MTGSKLAPTTEELRNYYMRHGGTWEEFDAYLALQKAAAVREQMDFIKKLLALEESVPAHGNVEESMKSYLACELAGIVAVMGKTVSMLEYQGGLSKEPHAD